MIINLRGAGGSGKSTVVRRVMDLYPQKLAIRKPVEGKDRKQPIGYLLHRPDGKSLYIVGHYEIACGGCDTLPSMDYVYDTVRAAHAEGLDVLYEGVIVTADTARCIRLHTDGLPLIVVGMSTSLADCLAGIQSRRDARGDVRPLNPKPTTAKHKRTVVGMRIIKDAGVDARWADREGAFALVRDALGFTHG